MDITLHIICLGVNNVSRYTDAVKRILGRVAPVSIRGRVLPGRMTLQPATRSPPPRQVPGNSASTNDTLSTEVAVDTATLAVVIASAVA